MLDAKTINSINDFLEANLFIAVVMVNVVLIYGRHVPISDGYAVDWVWGWWKECQIISTTPKYKTLERTLCGSFTRLRHSWFVLTRASATFAVSSYYTGGFLLGQRSFSPWFVLFWVLVFLSAFSIIRW